MNRNFLAVAILRRLNNDVFQIRFVCESKPPTILSIILVLDVCETPSRVSRWLDGVILRLQLSLRPTIIT